MAAQNNEAPNLTQRRDVAHVLLEAYKGLSGCCILSYISIIIIIVVVIVMYRHVHVCMVSVFTVACGCVLYK